MYKGKLLIKEKILKNFGKQRQKNMELTFLYLDKTLCLILNSIIKIT